MAVVFDLDGTLLDTLLDIANSANSALEDRGFATHEVDAYRFFVGDGVAKLFARALPPGKRDEDTIASCVETFRVNYKQNWNANTRPYAGVPELLDGLSARGAKLAVLSNKPDFFTKQCVKDLLRGWDFEAVLGEREGVPRKPDPSAAFEIANTLGIKTASFLYLGDTAIDMKTAVAAGMFPVGALWGFRTREELAQNGAKALLENPQDLLDYLDKAGRSTGC